MGVLSQRETARTGLSSVTASLRVDRDVSARDDGTATVLVVDDEPGLVDLYEEYLSDSHRVRSATDGDEAIDELDPSVDVVLLDRSLPGTAGDEVLAAIEGSEPDPRVALVSAVPPDYDIIEMGMDEYLVKPVTRAEVRETVERLLLLDAYTDRQQELNALRLKRNVLEVEKSGTELSTNEEYRDLCDRIDRLEGTVEELTDSLDGTALERYS